MECFKGIIALDIDGTITHDKHRLEKEVLDLLNHLLQNRWQIIFITGRTFSFALPILSGLSSPYFLAVQNGAALYSMPEGKLVEKYYLNTKIIPSLNEIFSHEPDGILVESGKDQHDLCYYRPADFTPEELEYIRFRISISPENWIPLSSFHELPIQEFAVGKYFATEAKAYEIAEKIHQFEKDRFNIVVIRDPFRLGHYLAHINHRQASKGKILKSFLNRQKNKMHVIAAGDDYNDLEMLEASDFKIVMSDAPQLLKDKADLIASSAKELGIIAALKKGVAHFDRFLF